MKTKHKGKITEWGILTIISFLFYDVIWMPTSEGFAFPQIKGVAYYLLADFIYCAFLSLAHPTKFFRVNRKCIANINHIKKISLFFKSKLMLRIDGCNDEYIIVSQERSALLKKLLDK